MFISYPIDFFLDIFDIVVYHTLHLRTQCVNSTRTRIIYAHSKRTFWNRGQPNVSFFLDIWSIVVWQCSDRT